MKPDQALGAINESLRIVQRNELREQKDALFEVQDNFANLARALKHADASMNRLIQRRDKVEEAIVDVRSELLAYRTELSSTPEDAVEAIFEQVRASDDPFTTGGEWMMRITNGITDIIHQHEKGDADGD